MQGMREFPDGFFDLAIVDPPYGIGIDGQRKRVCRNPKHNRKEHSREGWDNKPPTEEYFRELERVSREQIIWGGNYFVPMLKQAHKGWLIWDKGQRGLSMSDCELAYTSFDTPTRIFTQKKTLYLAGKITGDPFYRSKFYEAQKKLEDGGFIVVNPALLPSEGFTWEAYMRMSGAMLTECAEICFLPDWKESKGAKYEFGEAIAQNKPFFFFEDWEVKQNAEK